MVCDLSGMDIANASLLDEATACAEAMTLCRRVKEADAQRNTFWIDSDCHPQNIDLVQTRAEALGLQVVVGDRRNPQIGSEVFGVLVQYPGSSGEVGDPSAVVEAAHRAGALVVFAADLLALTLLKTPGDWGADVAVGSAQRFGVPLGFGGPHAAFFATRDAFKRSMPGRLVGVSKDSGAVRRSASRWAPGSNTSVARRPPRTSAPPRRSWPTWRWPTPPTTGRRV